MGLYQINKPKPQPPPGKPLSPSTILDPNWTKAKTVLLILSIKHIKQTSKGTANITILM